MAKVYSYQRFSTPEQAKGDSLRRQDDLAKKWCREHGHELDLKLKMTDKGLSAYAGKHRSKGQLGLFLQAVSDGKVDPGSILLVENLDRLSRQGVLEQFDLIRGLISAGITIEVISPPYTLSERTLAEQEGLIFMVAGEATRGHRESRRKSTMLAAAWESKRKRLGPGAILTRRLPAWLRWDDREKKIVPIPDKAAIVARIFAMAIKGCGPQRICAVFTAEGVPMLSGRKSKRKGWYPSYVKKILHSPTVIGLFQPHQDRSGTPRTPIGNPIRNYYPAVIEDADFARAAEVMAARRRGGGGGHTVRSGTVQNLVPTQLYCAHCGDRVRYYNKGPKDVALYGCAGARIVRGKCRWVAVPHPVLEAHLIASLLSVDFGALETSSPAEALRGQLATKRMELSTNAKRTERLVAAIADGDAPKAVVDAIAKHEAKGKTLERDIATLERKVAAADDTARSVAQLSGLAKRLGTVEGRAEIRSLLSLIVDRVDLVTCGDITAEKMVDQRRDQRHLTVHFQGGVGSVIPGMCGTSGGSDERLLTFRQTLLDGEIPWPDGCAIDLLVGVDGRPSAAMVSDQTSTKRASPWKLADIPDEVLARVIAYARFTAAKTVVAGGAACEPEAWSALFGGRKFMRVAKADVEAWDRRQAADVTAAPAN